LKGLNGILVAPGFGDRGIELPILKRFNMQERIIFHFLESVWVCKWQL